MAKFFNKILDYIGLEEEFDETAVAAEAVGAVGQASMYTSEAVAPQAAKTTTRRRESKDSKVVSMVQNATSNNLIIFRPVSCEDASTMIDSLKMRKPVIANFETIDHEKAQRILDIMSGAMYSLSGTVHKVAKNIYVFAPDNVDVTGESKTANNQRINSFFSDVSK